MNRTNLLVTSAVVAFVAATGVSMAQQERTPQQERAAPAEKSAPHNAPGAGKQMPNGRAGEAPQNRSRSETTGQAPRGSQQGERNSEQEPGKTKPPSRSERNQQNRTTGQAPREDQLNRAPDQNRTTGQAPREDQRNRAPDQNRTTGQAPREDRTTGQGAAGTRATINLTPEKRTQIHELIIRERNAPRISNPKFSVTVGTRVPRTVRFRSLPRAIVDIEPEWRGFEYFMVGDEIVVVDPRTKEIVAILET